MAQPFDAATRRPNGDPFPVAEGLSTEGSRYAAFSTSATGVLVHARGDALLLNRLAWFDRKGTRLGQLGDAAGYLNVALSPDERRVAATIATGSPPNIDVWTIDTVRGVSSRLTFDPGSEHSPIWSPDGLQVVFASLRPTEAGLRQKTAAGTANDDALLKTDGPMPALTPNDWSTDGRFVLYTAPGKTGTGNNLWVLPLAGDRKPFPIAEGPGQEGRAAFSPDGRWIAYTSDESGIPHVYVQPFPATGGRFQVSKNGGVQPVWRRDGKELFFLDLDRRLTSVPVETARQFEAGIPRALFQTVSNLTIRQYAVTNDGERFLMIVARSDQDASPLPLTIVVNWLAAVQK